MFRRPRKLNGEVSPDLRRSHTDPRRTVYRKGNDDSCCPSDGYDARKWQVAALFALGQGADVIMEDDTKKQRQNFMLQVLEGAVREEFDIRFVEQFWPFTKLAFKEARYRRRPRLKTNINLARLPRLPPPDQASIPILRVATNLWKWLRLTSIGLLTVVQQLTWIERSPITQRRSALIRKTPKPSTIGV